jgi:hypothetical protein
MSYVLLRGVRPREDRPRRIGSRFAGSLLLALLALPSASFAIDPSLCKDDGVTEVPPFAKGRDANGCLVVDPGNGDADILFQYEEYNKKGVADYGTQCKSTTTVIRELDASDHGKCRTRDKAPLADNQCTYIAWNVTIDNYLDDCAQNEDIHKASWSGRENTLWYNVNLFNGWKCKDTVAGGWSGPNGLRCNGGETTSKHTDGLQLNGPANNGGWFAMIDSKIVNAGISLLRMGSVPDGQGFGPKPNLLVQGFEAAQKQSVGEARTYFDDCDARGTDSCRDNRIDMATDWDAVWLVDVYGNVHFDGFHGDTNKVIVVNTGCNEQGCDGTIGYNSRNWPHPVSGAMNGPGVCPNGLITQSVAASDGSVKATFCYTSLEKALADTPTSTANQGDCPSAYCPHVRPPFIHLSSAGWENPPTTAKQRPRTPALEP